MKEIRLYADSSFLVSLYRDDANHDAAMELMTRLQTGLIFTPLHRIEVRNALRNAQAALLITTDEKRSAFRQLDVDVKDGLLIHQPLDWTEVLRHADTLSEKHAASDGQRTIDLLHVAAAVACKAGVFLSFDKRQRKLAVAVGLKVRP